MLSRKVSTNSSIESNNLLNYVREFSHHANQYKKYKTEESLVLLNRSASLLTTAIQPQQFINNGNLELTKFFIDLHSALTCLPMDSDALWSCIAVLQYCARNLGMHHVLVHEYRFIPILAYTLKRMQQSAHDKQQKVLILLQELTFGIRIQLEEPYVSVLLDELVQIVYQAAEMGEEETHGHLALSILINLCYKNFVVLFRFLRSINISCFSKAIQNYNMLASKMLIIISEDIHLPDQKELHPFLRSNFAAVEECLKTWNASYLRHIVEFLKDSKEHNGLHQAMLSYEYYCNDIEKLLNYLENHSSLDDSNDDILGKQQQTCMGLLFELITYIMELSITKNGENGTENSIISLDSNMGRIYELLMNWLESDVCGVMAINLLNALVTLGKTESIVPRIARDPSVIVQLTNITEKSEASPAVTSAILRLFISLLQQSKTEKLILSKISESYFDKILTTVLTFKPECALPNETLSMIEIEKSVHCLWLLINFADIAKKAYFEKCCVILQLPQIQYALARAITGSNEDVCTAVMKMSKFEHFPRVEVAKIITKLSNNINVWKPSINEYTINMSTIFKSHRDFFNKELEQRLQALIETISTAQANNQLNNLNTSQIIELFNYKIQKYSAAEECMQNELKQASCQITSLTQRITLQNSELEKYQNMNFELHINRESLQSQCKDLTRQKDNLKRSVTDLMKKLANLSDALLVSERKLSAKVAEFLELQKSFTNLQKQLTTKVEEVEKLQAFNKESNLRIDKLKKTISAYEIDIKEKVRCIEEKERELTKTQKCLEEQKDARKKYEDVINALEAQLQEKNEQIVNYEAELSETEELRKTIMSLMESKKPKRKL